MPSDATAAEPVRALVVEKTPFGDDALWPDTYVWLFEPLAEGARVLVEHRGRRGRVPAESLVRCPVPPPSLEGLRRLDPCFGLPRERFELVVERPWTFSVLRCRDHGAYFVEDVRGGVAIRTRLIFVGPRPEQSWESVAARLHGLSDDMLSFRGIAL